MCQVIKTFWSVFGKYFIRFVLFPDEEKMDDGEEVPLVIDNDEVVSNIFLYNLYR